MIIRVEEYWKSGSGRVPMIVQQVAGFGVDADGGPMMRNARTRMVMLAIGFSWIASEQSEGQITNAGRGSTAQGDILRGEGVFLQGAGWYDLNEAKAAAQNADTFMKIEKWNQELQKAYRQEYNAAVERRRNQTERAFLEAQRKHAEREVQLRTKPSADDIQQGVVLNALLSDLSDQSIHESSWRGAKVALPPDLGVKSLVYRFTPKPGSKEGKKMGQGVIALARLDKKGHWPAVLQGKEIEPERLAYEAAYEKVRDKSIAGEPILDSIFVMDGALAKLKAKVGTAVPPARNARVEAQRIVGELEAATVMFNAETLDFANEMISDTQKHEAKTVGELLAFMRKYRLMFASADSSPRVGEVYQTLYRLMQEQKESLVLKGEKMPAAVDDGRWMSLFNGRDLNGWFVDGGDEGSWRVENGTIVGLGRDYRTRNYLLSEKEYGDFVLHLDFQMEDKGGGGVTFRALPGEMMPMNGKPIFDHPLVKLVAIKGREETGTTHWITDSMYNNPDQSAHMLPVGSWNRLEIEVDGRSLLVSVNGARIDSASLGPNARFTDGTVPALGRVKGRIGFQKHTGTIRFRNVEIRELNANNNQPNAMR